MAAPSSAVNKDDLLINFSHFLHGTPHQRLTTAQSILQGFQTSGFIYLFDHPIPRPSISSAFASSAGFFARPLSQKEALAWTTPEANRGYVATGREKTSNAGSKEEVEALRQEVPDLKESFEIGREGVGELPNRWPEGNEQAGEFRVTMLRFFEECKMVHVQVMRAIAVGMGLDEGWFDSYTDEGDNTLRLLHYPSVNKEVFDKNASQVRAGEHSDYGSITLLFQDDKGGLQVKSPSGTFVGATPIPDTIVVNAGDLLARWSNDLIKSTMHRVVQPPAPPEGDVYPARYSMAYFCNPNFSSHIEAIEGTYGAGEGDRKYEGVNSGEYLVNRLTKTY